MEPLQRPALLVIDMQNDFLKVGFATAEAIEHHRPAVANCQRLLAGARLAGVPVLFSRVAFRPSYVDANPHSPARKLGRFLQMDSWGGAIVDELQPRADEIVIVKKRASVFFATELDLVLRALDVKTLVLAGTATHLAVESTARDGHAHDYEVCVVADATTAAQPEFEAPSLRALAHFFGQVQTTEEVLASWAGAPRSPRR